MSGANTERTNGWQEQIIGERMAVDQAFQERVIASELSNQSWELVMTAAEFKIDRPEDPERAELVVDLELLDSVLPAIAEVESSQAGSVGGRGGGPGVLARLRGLLRSGTTGEQYRAEAERLGEEYAASLQRRLEESGRWVSTLEQARGRPGPEN